MACSLDESRINAPSMKVTPFLIFSWVERNMKKTIPKKAKRSSWWVSLQFAYKSHDEIVKKTYDGVSAKMQ